MKNISILIFMLLLFSCNSKTESKIKTSINDNKEKPISIYAKKQVKIHTDTLSFLDYNDDGDYYLLNGKKNEKYYQYINDANDDRSFLRGDIIQIKWKNDTIIIAGDGDTPQAAECIVSAKKIKDGKVSEFRKSYKKQLKYHWSEEDNYSQDYLDKLYLIVEYYIANSQNEELKSCIARREQLEYSIEERTEDTKKYTVIGIGFVFEHRVNTIKWLYYEHNDENTLFEYDLPNEKLIKFE